MAISPQQASRVWDNAIQLYNKADVEHAFDAMAQEITLALAGSDPLILGVMNGGLIPTAHLLTRLDFPLRQDYIHATRYRGATSGGELRWIRRSDRSFDGETILIVDDILDEGITLQAIAEHCRQRGAERVLSAVLVEKRHARGNGFSPDFIGLKVEDRYVFGFGMDYKGYLRNAMGIFAVTDE